jgi:hypothetical protein
VWLSQKIKIKIKNNKKRREEKAFPIESPRTVVMMNSLPAR